jgi:hypothetical protein
VTRRDLSGHAPLNAGGAAREIRRVDVHVIHCEKSRAPEALALGRRA